MRGEGERPESVDCCLLSGVRLSGVEAIVMHRRWKTGDGRRKLVGCWLMSVVRLRVCLAGGREVEACQAERSRSLIYLKNICNHQ